MSSGGSVGEHGAALGATSRTPAARRISVLVVDDVYLIRKQVAQLIAADQRLRLLGTACDGVEAVKMIEALRPDLVVLDVFMPNMDGAGVLRWIKENVSDTKVLILTVGPDPGLHDTLILHPDSMLYKEAVAREGEICEEIVALLEGREDTAGCELLRAAAPLAKERPNLTPSELEVLRCSAQDASAKQIAARLGLTPKYVQNKLSIIRRKLGVTSTTGAVAKAYEIGLLPGQDRPYTK